MSNSLKILMLEDNPSDTELIQRELKKAGLSFTSEIVETQVKFENALEVFKPDIILSDYSLPSFDGLSAFNIKQKINPDIPFIIISGTIGEEKAVELIRSGIDDYILKKSLIRLPLAINHTLKIRQVEKEKEKRAAELALSEATLKQAQAIAHVGSWKTDFTSHTSIWSDETCRIYGVLPEENKQTFQSWLSFIHPEDLESVEKEIEQSRTSLKDTSFFHRIKRNDGTVRYIYSVAKFILNHERNLIDLYGISHDITELRKVEKALKISEKDLIKGERIAKFGYWKLKLDENKIYFSEGARTIYGIDVDVLPREDVKSFRLPEYNSSIDEAMLALIKENKPYNFEYKIKKKSDGAIIDVHSIAEYNPKIRAVFGTIQDITDKKIVGEKLIQSENQVRNFASKLTHSMEEDRRRIAREIHDELGQQLTAFKMGIDWVLHKQIDPEGEVATKLNELLKMSDAAVTSIRRISADLRPAIIDDLGLIAALDGLCHDLNKRGIACRFISTAKERKFEDTFSINTYRIAQETLTNVIRHAQANSVTVSVSENEKELLLEITDDGKGINEEDILKSKHLGITGMNERAALLGGKLTIEGTKNKGTRTKLVLPLKNN